MGCNPGEGESRGLIGFQQNEATRPTEKCGRTAARLDEKRTCSSAVSAGLATQSLEESWTTSMSASQPAASALRSCENQGGERNLRVCASVLIAQSLSQLCSILYSSAPILPWALRGGLHSESVRSKRLTRGRQHLQVEGACAETPSPHTFLVSIDNAVCTDSYRCKYRRSGLLRSRPH